jgi:hypothetical protein
MYARNAVLRARLEMAVCSYFLVKRLLDDQMAVGM